MCDLPGVSIAWHSDVFLLRCWCHNKWNSNSHTTVIHVIGLISTAGNTRTPENRSSDNAQRFLCLFLVCVWCTSVHVGCVVLFCCSCLSQEHRKQLSGSHQIFCNESCEWWKVRRHRYDAFRTEEWCRVDFLSILLWWTGFDMHMFVSEALLCVMAVQMLLKCSDFSAGKLYWNDSYHGHYLILSLFLYLLCCTVISSVKIQVKI